MSDPISNTAHNLDLNRPLQIYRRERSVEIELSELRGLTTRSLVARVESKGDATLSNEALVSVTRALLRSSQQEQARRVLQMLAVRVTGHALRHLDVWGVRVKEAREDLHQEMVRMMCECVFSLETDQEFWECRFWTCFDRRARTILRNALRAGQSEASLDDLADTSPGILKDTRLSVEQKTQVSIALQKIPEPYRTAFYLRHYGGYSEESGDPDEITISRILNVGGRTVRNYLRHAETYLSEWRNSDAEH